MPAVNAEGTPLKFTLVDIETNAAAKLAPPTKCEYVIITNAYWLSAVGATPLQVLGFTPKRKRAIITINYTGATPALVAIGTNASDVEQAMQAPAEFIGAVAYISAPFSYDVQGNTELWAGLITAGTNPCVVSAIKEIER